MLIYLIIAAALVLIDFLIKAWVTAHIPLGESQQLIPGVIDLTHIRNTGAAFSMFEGKQWFFYITTLLAFGVVAMLWRDSLHKPIYRLGLTLITAGAIGNFIDRLRFQYVRSRPSRGALIRLSRRMKPLTRAVRCKNGCKMAW